MSQSSLNKTLTGQWGPTSPPKHFASSRKGAKSSSQGCRCPSSSYHLSLIVRSWERKGESCISPRRVIWPVLRIRGVAKEPEAAPRVDASLPRPSGDWSHQVAVRRPGGGTDYGTRGPPCETRLLTRLPTEVLFLCHARHAFLTSLFTSIFAGETEVPRPGAATPTKVAAGTLGINALSACMDACR